MALLAERKAEKGRFNGQGFPQVVDLLNVFPTINNIKIVDMFFFLITSHDKIHLTKMVCQGVQRKGFL